MLSSIDCFIELSVICIEVEFDAKVKKSCLKYFKLKMKLVEKCWFECHDLRDFIHTDRTLLTCGLRVNGCVLQNLFWLKYWHTELLIYKRCHRIGLS